MTNRLREWVIGLPLLIALELGALASSPASYAATKDCASEHAACAELTVDLETPTSAIADQMAPVTVVIANNGHRAKGAASVPAGTRLLHLQFSTPVGNGNAPVNDPFRTGPLAGYACTAAGAPVTSIDCSATSNDLIAVNASRTFEFKIDTPSDVQRLKSRRHLEITALLDPDNTLGSIRDGKDRATGGVDVAPPSFTTIPGPFDPLDEGQLFNSMVSLICSGDGLGGVMFGSMTCIVQFHPATQATGTFIATPIFYATVDGQKFKSGAGLVPGGSCSGGAYDGPYQSFINCGAGPISFAPNQMVNVAAFSNWVDPNPDEPINANEEWRICANTSGNLSTQVRRRCK